MTGAILTLNAGSSSLKFALFAHEKTPRQLAAGEADLTSAPPSFRVAGAAPFTRPLAQPTQTEALREVIAWVEAQRLDLVAVGHRIVHGGERYRAPARLDSDAVRALSALSPIAPLHQPHNLAAVSAVAAARPDLPQIGCFDTAFHATQSRLETLYAIPRALTQEGVRRYGFHGLSYEYIASILADHLGDAARGRVIVAHLGNGASLCAMRDLRSVATTMGFSALDGPPMGTRCGAIDPGVLLYLMQENGMTPDAVSDLLYRRSGLLGVSGISSDMRALLASDAPQAKEAVDLFCLRVAREIDALAAALEGLDALVFTAGIGEHAAPVRAAVMRRCAWLGLALDDAANAANATTISAGDGRARALVLQTDEDLMIARHVASILAA